MKIRRYLPSAQFALMGGALLISGGLIWGAERIMRPPSGSLMASEQLKGTLDTDADGLPDWEEALYGTEASNPDSDADGIPDGVEVTMKRDPAYPGAGFIGGTDSGTDASFGALVNAAQTSNLTESVGRALLLSLSAAKQQGLGSDQPTQDDIVVAALAQIPSQTALAYTAERLHIISDTPAARNAYGNAVMSALRTHSAASYFEVQLALSLALDNSDAEQAGKLEQAGDEYRALSNDFISLPVPTGLAELHFELANNTAAQAGACKDMAAILSDSIRGLAGWQRFEDLSAKNIVVFTRLNKEFEKGGILFTKDEPGTSWSLFGTQP